MESIVPVIKQFTSNGSGCLVCVVLLSICGPHWIAASLSTPAHQQSAFIVIHPSPTFTPDLGTTIVTLTSPGGQDSADASRLSPSATSTLPILLDYFTTSSISSHSILVTTDVLGTEFVSVVSSISHQLESIPTSVHISSTIVTSASIPQLHILNATKSYATASSISAFPSNNTTKKTTFTNVSDGSNMAAGFGNRGNGSCSGNITGCPEYNGRHVMTLTTTEIIAIAVGAAVIVIIVVCFLLFMCRHRQTLSGSKADLSAYWEDNVTLSYINGHLDYPKDVSDEMISLDNDSFLNSLDSISFSNLWATEHAKHTNF